jgi:hypothetical protein
MIRRPKPPKKRRRVEDSSDDDVAEYALRLIDWLIMLIVVPGYNPRRQQGEPHLHLVRSNNSWFGIQTNDIEGCVYACIHAARSCTWRTSEDSTTSATCL